MTDKMTLKETHDNARKWNEEHPIDCDLDVLLHFLYIVRNWDYYEKILNGRERKVYVTTNKAIYGNVEKEFWQD